MSRDDHMKDYAKSIIQGQTYKRLCKINCPKTIKNLCKISHTLILQKKLSLEFVVIYACPKYGWTFLKTNQNGFVCFYQGASIPIWLKKKAHTNCFIVVMLFKIQFDNLYKIWNIWFWLIPRKFSEKDPNWAQKMKQVSIFL